MLFIASRLSLRLALVIASLAWAAVVFTNTIGDPGRGERIASAVLDDDAARAEISAPITAAVLRTTGLPDEQRTTVSIAVDELLRDPAGARAFIDPFAGSWARLLGEDDPRPAQFDLAPLLDEVERLLVPLGVDVSTLDGFTADDPVIADTAPVPARIEVPSVPLPRTQLGWMAGVRRGIAGSVAPLALIAAAFAVLAFALGDRRRVLRRVGLWAIFAGALWVVIPPLLVWAARSWAPGADSVIATSVDVATAGMRTTAIVVVASGIGLVIASVVLPATVGAPRDLEEPTARPPVEPAWAPASASAQATVDPTLVYPTPPVAPPSAFTPTPASTPRITGPGWAIVDPTEPIATAESDDLDPDRQSVWDYYSS